MHTSTHFMLYLIVQRSRSQRREKCTNDINLCTWLILYSSSHVQDNTSNIMYGLSNRRNKRSVTMINAEEVVMSREEYQRFIAEQVKQTSYIIYQTHECINVHVHYNRALIFWVQYIICITQVEVILTTRNARGRNRNSSGSSIFNYS